MVKIHSTRLIDSNYNDIDFVEMDKKFGIEYVYEVLTSGHKPNPNMHLINAKNELAFIGIEDSHMELGKVGLHKTIMWVPAHILNDGGYTVRLAVDSYNPFMVFAEARDALFFEVIEDINKRRHDFKRKIPGVLRPQLEWESTILTH